MTKNENSNERSHHGHGKPKSNGGKSSNKSTTNSQSKFIFNIKKAKRNDHQIKATFEDSEGNQIKELIHTFADGDRKELLIYFEKQLLKLGNRYNLFTEGKWKVLCQILGCALEGRCEEIWESQVESLRGHNTGNSAAQRDKFKKAIQKFNKKYLGSATIDHQKDAMENGQLRYEGTDHEKTVERLFQINEDIELLSDDAEPFTMREMVRKIIPQNLKPAAKLKYLDKGGAKLREKDEVIELAREISEILDAEYEVEQARKQKQNNRNTHNHYGSQGDSQPAKEKRDTAPCRKHDGKHKWKDCPDNWSNKDRNSAAQETPTPHNNNKSRSNRGEVTTTESGNSSSRSCSRGVRFEEVDYETDDDASSRGEVMAINTTQRAANLHPITVITLPDKHQKRVACKVLLDQCCTDKGLISQELVEMLDLPTTKGTPRIFTTAAGTVSADRILKNRQCDASMPINQSHIHCQTHDHSLSEKQQL